MPPSFLDVLKPDADALLRCISPRIDSTMLKDIAASDYGSDVEKHLAKLRLIRDAGQFDEPLAWHPGEVLELVRWARPDFPESTPGARGERGHWMRAFACAALIRAAGEIPNRSLRSGWNQTVIPLIDSIRHLDAGLDEPAAQSFAWLIQRSAALPDADELAFLGVGLLWCILQTRPPSPDITVVQLAEWIDEQERTDNRMGYAGDWLLRTSSYNIYHRKWKELGYAFTKLELADRSTALREWVALIGNALADG